MTINYRPISLISNIAKILEKIVKIQLSNFLEENNYFTVNQNRFRKNRGAEEAINKLQEKITKALDNKQKCAVVFQDLTKAFDLVVHEKVARERL